MDRDIEQAGTAIVRVGPRGAMEGDDFVAGDLVAVMGVAESRRGPYGVVVRDDPGRWRAIHVDDCTPANALARTLWRVNNWKLADAGGRKR